MATLAYSEKGTAKQPTVSEVEIEAGKHGDDNPITVEARRNWNGDHAIPDIEGWEAAELQATTWKHWILNCIYLIFPGLFLGLCITLGVLDGRVVHTQTVDLVTIIKEDLTYYGLSQALKVSVTLYPILFALCLGKLLKTIINYKAEKGTRLITLEQLMATKSFGNAVTVPLTFKRLNTTAIILFAVWATSPLTSQALQRVFSVDLATFETFPATLSYLNLMPQHIPEGWLLSSYIEPGPFDNANDTWDPTAQSTLLALIKNQKVGLNVSAVDAFGYAKVPLLSSVQDIFVQDKDGWYDVGRASFWPFSWGRSSFGKVAELRIPNVDWASLTGLPILGIPTNTSAHSTFTNITVTTGYWTFDCSPWNKTGYEALNKFKDWHTDCGSTCQDKDSVAVAAIATKLESVYGSPLPRLHFASRITTGRGSPGKLKPRTGTQAPGTPPADVYASTVCEWNTHAVDVEYICAGTDCAAARMRANNSTQGPTLPAYGHYSSSDNGVESDWTVDNSAQQIANYFISGFTRDFQVQLGGYQIESSTILEAWLYNLQPFAISKEELASNVLTVDLTRVDPATFSERLGRVVNTYWSLLMAPTIYTGVDASTFKSNIEFNSLEARFSNATGTIQHQHPVYQCHWAWFAVILFSVALVIVVILANAIIQARTLGPDFLGYVSALTYNNRYVPLPRGGNTLDAIERSRKLADLEVRLQDVRPDEEVGHVALSTIYGAQLKKGRKYA